MAGTYLSAWFLPVAIVSSTAMILPSEGAGSPCRPRRRTDQLDRRGRCRTVSPVGDLYLDWEYRITSVQLAVAMLAMGATLHVADFLAVVRLPRSFLTGLGVQMLVVPAVAYALLRSVDLDPGVAVGLAILASVPGGTVSNVFTYAGRGDVPLSIAITAVTTLACIVTVPIVLDALVGPFVPPDFVLPRGRIALEIVGTLLVPLAAGMALLRLRATTAAWVSAWALRATAVLIGVIVVGSAAAGRLDPEAMGLRNLAVVVGFAVLLCLLGVGPWC